MTGMESKKEKRTAVFRSSPVHSAAINVEPDLEMPGMTANVWARATTINLSSPWWPLFYFRMYGSVQ